MASEAKRGLIRITTNYARLITTIILGLVLVPLLIEALGDDGWALIALLGSTVGLASMAQAVVRESLVRELGAAFHSDDGRDFVSTYNSALLVSVILAVISVVIFVVLAIALPVLDIPAELIPTGRVVIAAVGAETFIVLLLAPPMNMWRVTERFTAYNIWLILQRCCYVAAALTLIMRRVEDTGRSVELYAIVSSSLFAALTILASVIMALIDRRVIPAPSTIRRSAIKTVLKIGGWNAAANASLLLHRRIAPIMMNLGFGLSGNLVLGIAIQLTVSVRRLTRGMTEGLDAVSARISTLEGDEAVRSLMHHSTRLHGFATFPLVAIIWVLTEPLIMLWVGNRIEDPATTVPIIAMLVRIMTVGMAARAISDCWLGILYGAGYVQRYAPLIIAGAVANPLLTIALYWMLPEDIRYTCVPAAYSIVFVIFHGCLVPVVGARALGIGYRDFLLPLIRPCIVALLCAPILVFAMRGTADWTIPRLFVVTGLYGTLYVGLCIGFVMDAPERARFTKAAMRRLGKKE